MEAPHDRTSHLARLNWSRLLFRMVLTGILAISVHVVLLDVLHVPYPAGLPQSGVIAYLNYAASVLAFIVFYDLAADKFVGRSLAWRCLALSLLNVMLNEVFRVSFIEGVMSMVWTHGLVHNFPRLVPLVLVCCLIVPATPKLPRLCQKIAAALLIAALIFFVCRPLVNSGFTRLLQAVSYPDYNAVYPETSWRVQVAIYLGFVEPTAACFAMVALVWERLSAPLTLRVGEFTLLIMLIKGVFFLPFIYPFYAKMSTLLAILSAGQFFLEWLTLGLLTAVTWRSCCKPPRVASD